MKINISPKCLKQRRPRIASSFKKELRQISDVEFELLTLTGRQPHSHLREVLVEIQHVQPEKKRPAPVVALTSKQSRRAGFLRSLTT